MDAQHFRLELRRRLEASGDDILLRIALAPDFDRPIEFTGPELAARSTALAREYVRAPENTVVLLLLPHSVELFLLHIGLILEGRLPAILAWPTSRIDAEKYQRNLLHQLRNLPASQLITSPKLVENLAPALPYQSTVCPFAGHEAYEQAFAARLSLDGLSPLPSQKSAENDPGDAVFLQFSGGTTGAQKCVVVTGAMLDAQMSRLRECLEFGPNDGVASWLPMYHDMGLIACLWFPLWHGCPSIQFAASDWLLNPDLLFRYLSRYKATFCWLPNFAFSYLASQRERMKGPYSLDHVRGFVNCSEPVRQRSLSSFAETFADWGVHSVQGQASYAMAENVFAVTQTPLTAAPATIARSSVRQRSAAYSDLAFDLIDDVYVSSGKVLGGMEVRISNHNGSILSQREPGEIQIKAESLFNGYWGNDGFVRNTLSEDGWYSTGDYGFVDDGELYVVGRFKDIIIVGGQNVFPEDVEAIVNTIEGVYPGRVVVFGITDESMGTEAMAVVAELRGAYEPQRASNIERQVKQLVLAAIGIAPRYAYAAPERWIVKSTAGKISRRDTRERFIKEKLTRKAG